MRMHRLGLGIMICMLFCSAVPIIAQQYPWERLPPAPVLPDAEHSGAAAVNGIRLWYAVFGHGDPVILLHGGLANSNYWGAADPASGTALSDHRARQPRSRPQYTYRRADRV
jgi:hypothetical protein